MRTPLVAGNWKMHKTLGEARELVAGILAGLDEIAGVDVLVCPPVHLLFPMAKAVHGSRVMLGAQNVHEETHGAYTGEVSVAMIQEAGCSHIIVGHSERRHVFGETATRLGKKVRAVLDGGLTAIYCVGETLDQREAGETESVVSRQIDEALDASLDCDRLVIAYEPVWAIGTGKTASPEQAQEVHALIRARLASTFGAEVADGMRILYGGSVKPANAGSLMSQADVDGALVGGACLVAGDFLAIMSATAACAV